MKRKVFKKRMRRAERKAILIFKRRRGSHWWWQSMARHRERLAKMARSRVSESTTGA